MNKWLKQFEDTMAAAAFAEEGEFSTAAATLRGRKTILIALSGNEADEKAFKYAMNSCQRMGAELEILYSGMKNKVVPASIRSQLHSNGISYGFSRVTGCVKEAVIKLTVNRSDILFVILESADGIDMNCKKVNKTISRAWMNLKCPLVVVSDMAGA